MPPVCLYAPYVHMPPGVYNPHMPPYSSMPLCFSEALHVVGGCNGLPFVLGHPPLHHPCLGVPPLYYTPHSVIGSLCISMFRDISILCGPFPSVRKGLGVPPSVGGWGHQHLRCPYPHSCTLFVVHYVSHFDYGSDYYSSS